MCRVQGCRVNPCRKGDKPLLQSVPTFGTAGLPRSAENEQTRITAAKAINSISRNGRDCRRSGRRSGVVA